MVTRYTYDLANMLEEFDASGRVKAIYTSGRIDEPLVMQRDLDESGVFEPQEAFTYLSDALGSVVALADNTGAIRESYRYDAFGAVQPAKSALQNPFRFTGREWDEESGLYYYRARYYDTALGRFLQPDALWNRSRPVTLNRYVYVENNPVNLVDPSGLKPEDRVVFAWEHSTILGETISAQKVVVMRNGEMMPGYSRISIIDENTGQNSTSNWGILNLNNGQMLSGKIPMTAAESRNMRMANLEQFNNPFSESEYIMNSVMSTPGAIYDTVVDMGVSAGLLDAPRN